MWVEVTPMNDSRFGCAVVAHQGKIFVSGGFGSDKNILSSAEVYDPGIVLKQFVTELEIISTSTLGRYFVISVTRWLHYLFKIGPFTRNKISQQQKNFAKIRFKISPKY